MLSRDNSAKNLKDEKMLMKEAAHRYSEAEDHMITFVNQPNKARMLKVSLEHDTRLNSEKV